MAEKLARVFLYAFLAIFPFGFRREAFRFIPGFHEYESFFIYASDIFLVVFLIAGIKIILNNKKIETKKKKIIPGVLFILGMGVSILISPLPFLSFLFLTKIFLLMAAAFLIGELSKLKKINPEKIFAIVSIGAIIQSVIAFFQFKTQESLGLYFLGEPILNQESGGISKITIEGAKIIRAYGTFLHPNILAAFLMTGIASLIYFYFREKKFWRKTSKIAGIYIITLGLLLTFSRQAWLASFFTIIIFSALFIYKKKTAGIKKIIPVFLIFIFAMMPVKKFLRERVSLSAKEDAVTERLAYNEMGMDLIKENPKGVGAGTQVFYAQKNQYYKKFGMDKVWLWQPIHNIYLLIAAEIGIIGLIMFLWLITNLLFSKKIYGSNSEEITAKIIMLSFLIIGFSDHFFWTINQGQVMFWTIVGLLI